MFSRILINKNKPTKTTFIIACVVFFLATSAGYIKSNYFDDANIPAESITAEDLSGSWFEVIPGTEYQGFTLHKDGTAESINMNTLLVQKWRLDESYLVLTEKSIGNKGSSIGDERYKITFLSKKKLKLIRGNHTFEYERK